MTTLARAVGAQADQPRPFLLSSLLLFSSSAAFVAFSLLSGILLARHLGPTGRGQLAVILVWPMLFGGVAGLSLSSAITFFAASDPRLRPRLFANSVLTSLALGGVSAVAGLLILPRVVTLTGEQAPLVAANLLLIPLGLWSESATALLQGSSRFGHIAGCRVAGPSVTCTMLCLSALHGRISLTTAAVATFAGAGAQALLLLVRLGQNASLSLTPDFALLRRSLRYALRSHPGAIAGMANRRLDQTILTMTVAPRDLGLYAFATTLTELLNHGAASIAQVLLPKVAASEVGLRRRLAFRSARWTLLVSLAGAGALAVLAPLFIRHVWGAEFLPALPAIWWLLPGTVALGVSSTLCAALAGAGQPQAGAAAEMMSLLLSVPLLLLLIPRLGFSGAAIASTIGYASNAAVAIVWSRRALRPSRDAS